MPQNSTTLSLKYLRRVQSLDVGEKSGSYLESGSTTDRPLTMSSLMNSTPSKPSVTTQNTVNSKVTLPTSNSISNSTVENTVPNKNVIMSTPVMNTQKNVGLGGKDLKTISNIQTPKNPLAENIPEQIRRSIEDFKEFIRKEKKAKMEISQNYSKFSGKFVSDIVSVRTKLTTMTSKLNHNKRNTEILKQEAIEEFSNIKQLKYTVSLPKDYPYFCTITNAYFENFLDKCDKTLIVYQNQIDEICHRLLNKPLDVSLTANDLMEIMLRVHQSFVFVASELQISHANVESIKHQFSEYFDENSNKHI
ncbi:DgyrCDS5175 [Dimorphilus gyrociliatus]|uniref:DgyrCDS5175 n=1 Tax=Dimorphilus gyrociliatus TaxID=2664684 RepID=A0A7I8VKP2_9ANNE|nr:DgyrCDS5175 [Dimorphilus gyrociliatus]